jgi:hypothetical protein
MVLGVQCSAFKLSTSKHFRTLGQTFDSRAERGSGPRGSVGVLVLLSWGTAVQIRSKEIALHSSPKPAESKQAFNVSTHNSIRLQNRGPSLASTCIPPFSNITSTTTTTATTTTMGLFCLKFPSLPSLRRKKSTKGTKPTNTSAPAARVVDEKAAIRSLASPPAAAVPFLHVNSARLQPISSSEYLDSLERPQSTDKFLHFGRPVQPDEPIIIGTTAEKKEIAAADIIRELKAARKRKMPHNEFRDMAMSGRSDYVWLAINKDGEFSCFAPTSRSYVSDQCRRLECREHPGQPCVIVSRSSGPGVRA